MKGILAEIASMVKDFGSAPTFAEMPRKTLSALLLLNCLHA